MGHRSKTTFGPDNPPPKSPGRPRMTEEKRREAALRRAVEYDFKLECQRLLPIAVDQVEKHLTKGHFKPRETVDVLETLRDSVHGKPAQTIQSPGGGPLVGSFTVMLQHIDGAKNEKL